MINKEDNWRAYIYCVAFGLFVGCGLTFEWYEGRPFRLFNNRSKGIDTVRMGDTLFVISHKIDTQYYDFDESIDREAPNDNL
jgi:hypothetical protein